MGDEGVHPRSYEAQYHDAWVMKECIHGLTTQALHIVALGVFNIYI